VCLKQVNLLAKFHSILTDTTTAVTSRTKDAREGRHLMVSFEKVWDSYLKSIYSRRIAQGGFNPYVLDEELKVVEFLCMSYGTTKVYNAIKTASFMGMRSFKDIIRILNNEVNWVDQVPDDKKVVDFEMYRASRRRGAQSSTV
jgi:hypothetical protein